MSEPFNTLWNPEIKAHVFAEIEGLRRETLIILNERDRRYTERSSQQDKAVVDALAAAEKAVNAALVAADKAVEKEQANAEKWRNSANEWRQAMNDRETRFLGKDEAALMVSGVEARVTLLEKVGNMTAGGHQVVTAAWGYVVGAISCAALVVAVVIAIVKG
jgi:cystathionine beta-lyase/cystathionine gamma-synthase